jgi:hypothetical protein
MINSRVLYEGIIELNDIPDSNMKNVFILITRDYNKAENSAIYLKTLFKDLYGEIESNIIENIK